MTPPVRQAFNKQNLIFSNGKHFCLNKILNLESVTNHNASLFGCFSQHRHENSNDKMEV